MAVTVEELVAQHKRCEQAKNDLNSSDFLYPAGSGPLSNSYVEQGILQLKREVEVMKKMMKEATPEQIAEARRLARG
jgi:hypothetical protein